MGTNRQTDSLHRPRCVGHYVGTGYSYHGLAENCPHAECKALAEAHGRPRQQSPEDQLAQRVADDLYDQDYGRRG